MKMAELAELTEGILDRIRAERDRQDAKWGIRVHTPYGWLLILQEEIGEVAKALLEGAADEAFDELVQCAAVIVAWLEQWSIQSKT
jgi:NTP pyrophosphatase (non-canonical NTP hydrolase)